jgi:hypothetical protein
MFIMEYGHCRTTERARECIYEYAKGKEKQRARCLYFNVRIYEAKALLASPVMGLFYVLGRLINDLGARRWCCDEVIVRLVDSSCIRSTSSMIAMSPIRMTRLYEAASSTFDFVSSTLWCEQRTSLAKATSQLAKNWMRLKLRQLTQTSFDICWSVDHDWSYVDSLGLNACTWVAWRTGMNLYSWCGFVLFRLDETTSIKTRIYAHVYADDTKKHWS